MYKCPAPRPRVSCMDMGREATEQEGRIKMTSNNFMDEKSIGLVSFVCETDDWTISEGLDVPEMWERDWSKQAKQEASVERFRACFDIHPRWRIQIPT